MEMAADWLQRLHAANPDDGALEEWLDWCQRDPRNQQAFDELAAVWQASGLLKEELQQAPEAEPAPVSTPISMTAAYARPRRHTRRFALAASVAGLGLAVTAAWMINRPGATEVVAREYASPVGVNSTRTLEDGSILELGGGTRATVSFSDQARRVELHEGEIYVAVHKDAARPFSVEAGRLKVVATGTEFNVLRTDERTTVTVAEGSVDALYEGQSVETPNVSLQVSQQLIYSHATHRVTVRDTDPRDAVAWRTGMLSFYKEPLSEVVARMQRYMGQPIVIEDPQLASLPITSGARIDNLDGWLRALHHIHPVTVQVRDGRYLIGPQPAAGAH